VGEVGREFGFAHPGVEVRLAYPQEIMGVRSKPLMAKFIADMIRSGDPEWDVIWLDDNIYEYVARELGDPDWGARHLVDFRTVPGFVEAHKEFIAEDPIYAGQTGGVLVGPYIEGYYVAKWFSREVAQTLGLSIKERGMTFGDLLEYARRVHQHNQASSHRVALFYEASDWFTLEMLFQSLVKSRVPAFREAINEVSSPRKRAAMLEAFQAFEELGRYEPLIDSHSRNTWFDTRHLVLDGEALFYVHGTWMYNHWRGIDPDKLANMVPAQMPVFERVDHVLGGYIPTWAVLEGSPDRDAAISLVMWWARPQVAEKWVRYTKNPTGLRGNLSSATLGGDVFERFQADMSEAYGGNLHYSANAGYLLGRDNAQLQETVVEQLRLLATERVDARTAYSIVLAAAREGTDP